MEPTAQLKSESLSVFDPTRRERGWETIVREHEGVMRARIWNLLDRLGYQPGREMVEELVQEAYCRLFSDALRRWRGTTLRELLAYMGVIAERTVLDDHRGAQARKRNDIREVYVGRRRIEQIADPRDPEQDLLLAETQDVLLRRCRELPARRGRERNAWVARLAFLEGWTHEEIASAAGGRLSPANVACLIHRLRRRLARTGFGPSRPDRGSRRRGSRRRAI
jgi:RNA polymerase sigma factor (sigma-70 family)